MAYLWLEYAVIPKHHNDSHNYSSSNSNFFGLGSGAHLGSLTAIYIPQPPTFYKVVLSVFPTNIISALAQGDMLQVLFLAAFIGAVILKTGKSVPKFFSEMHDIVTGMVWVIMRFAPIGVFCLIVGMVSSLGTEVIVQVIDYFALVAFVLIIQV